MSGGLFSLGGVWGELVGGLGSGGLGGTSGGLRELLEPGWTFAAANALQNSRLLKGVSVKRHCLRAGTGTLMQKRRTGDRRSLFATETAGRSMGKSFIW